MNIYTKQKKFKLQKMVLSIVALAIMIGFLNMFQLPIKNTFYHASSHLFTVFSKAGASVSGFFAPIFGGGNIMQENSNLKQENERLLSQIMVLQDALKEYQAIKEIIEITKTDNVKLASANVVGLDADVDYVLINRGSEDGIAENMPVITSTKVLVGKTYKVYKNFSQVMLISNKGSVVDVKIQNADLSAPPVLGAIKGDGNLSFYLDLVSSYAKINQGDVVITSGLEGIFPKDLLIGKISSIEKNDAKPFQSAKIQPFFDVKNAGNLFVITNYLRR